MPIARLTRAVLAGLFACTLLAACGGGGEDTADREQQPVSIVTQDIAFEPEETRVEAVGTARARTTAVIYPKTGGEVEEVLFGTGQFVERGDPLVRLEAEEERLAVRLSRVAVQEAEQLLQRYRRIEDTGAISDSQIDEGETALQAARIELEQAELALAERTVRAPFSGFVGLTEIDPGARIQTSTPIVELDDRRILFVDFAVPEQVFRLLSEGDTVSLQPFSDPENPYDATIIGIDSRVNAEDRSFTVRAQIENELDDLRPGMSFRIAFAIPGQDYPVVPEEAIVWGSDGAFVWTVQDDGTAAQETVTILSREQGRVLVEAALEEGATIVVEGVQKLREGAPVNSVEDRGNAQQGSRPASGPAGDSGSTAGAGAP